MKKISSLTLTVLTILSLVVALPFSVHAVETSNLMIVETSIERENGLVIINAIPPTDDSLTNNNYVLSGLVRTSTANYWINPSNNYGFSVSALETAITVSANTWDKETAFQVFSYKGTTKRQAGKYDKYNVVSWGKYRRGIIAVTYIWYSGARVLETDTMMNTYYKWSLSGADGKMDAQNIMTHEFGHWLVLNDLYSDSDYWLTMYGYANYGETYKRTLGAGDILGLKAIYGS